MKILTIIGARPQFIKASVVSKALSKFPDVEEMLLHTGQHFDSNMSAVFFEQLGIPLPSYQLDIHGGSHGAMTGRMLLQIEEIILSGRPDRVLVYGDTNSTLAGALAATKLQVPVAHIEAGLRSFNMRMPEEINRILTDQISDILFCPTKAAVRNLEREGFMNRPIEVLNVGDVMQDSAIFFSEFAHSPTDFNVDRPFVLTTLHRAENTDDPVRLRSIADALNKIHRSIAEVVLPLHPRTRTALERAGVHLDVNLIAPVGYLEMVWLLQHSDLVMTDSGGVQKEAFFFGKTCVTLRDETEWIELVDMGANFLVGADTEAITAAADRYLGRAVQDAEDLYGGGKAAERIATRLRQT